MIRRVILAAAATWLSACPPPAKTAEHPLSRNLAPDISLKVGGADWSPSKAKGKVLVLDFWATWCVPCKDSFPRLDGIYRKYKDKGLELVGVTSDEDPAKIDKFVKETNATFPIGRDAGGKATDTYKVEKMPTTFVIDRKGVVRYAHGGYEPKDADDLDKEVQELVAEAP